ncbi:MAG: hypothetical protein JWP66_177 [Naasia sp.]|nr:hypothetical protein [Naasia sp.]
MELLFIALGGLLLGLAARYALPRRNTHGVALLPIFGAVFASVVWVALTWAGLAWDAGFIWWVTLGVTAAASALAAWRLGVVRERRDAARLADLSRPRV